jgi:hypothetical protein
LLSKDLSGGGGNSVMTAQRFLEDVEVALRTALRRTRQLTTCLIALESIRVLARGPSPDAEAIARIADHALARAKEG